MKIYCIITYSADFNIPNQTEPRISDTFITADHITACTYFHDRVEEERMFGYDHIYEETSNYFCCSEDNTITKINLIEKDI